MWFLSRVTRSLSDYLLPLQAVGMPQVVCLGFKCVCVYVCTCVCKCEWEWWGTRWLALNAPSQLSHGEVLSRVSTCFFSLLVRWQNKDIKPTPVTTPPPFPHIWIWVYEYTLKWASVFSNWSHTKQTGINKSWMAESWKTVFPPILLSFFCAHVIEAAQNYSCSLYDTLSRTLRRTADTDKFQWW